MKSAWNLKEHRWNLPWPQRVSQHDVVYLSPPSDPMEGLPVGNGDLGGLLWVENSRLCLAVNKVDAWDDGPDEHVRNWGAKEEDLQTALRSCGRLTVDLGLPLMEMIYLKDFQGRVSLADATARLDADSVLGRVAVRAYASHPDQVMVLRVETEATEPVAQSAEFARFGSREFGHWYSLVRRDPTLHTSGTEASVKDGCVMIHQTFRTLNLVVGMKLVPDAANQSAVERLHSRAGRTNVAPAAKLGYTIYIAAVTSENHPDPQAEVLRRLTDATKKGEKAIAVDHAADWREFWSRSTVYLSEDYLANIWHVILYFANSSCRGAYPPHFCNGIWGWNHDFVPWTFYFHWNMQWHAWPLHAANHAELALPYLNFRARQLPLAMDYARFLKRPGAFYADVSERRGWQDRGVDVNHTPPAQIAMDFWRHWQFTRDETFLRDKAYPVMREVTRFLLSLISLGEDGKYHVEPGSPLEGSGHCPDVISDLAMIRVLFPAVVEAMEILHADDLDAAKLRDIVERLTEPTWVKLDESEYRVENGRAVHGPGAGEGKELLSRDVPIAGYWPEKDRNLRTRLGCQPVPDYYGMPDVELQMVFPSGAVGMKDRGGTLYNGLATVARFHPLGDDVKVKDESTMTGEGEQDVCMGWCVIPVACARLGLKDETLAMLRNHVKLWQFYPQGFGHYGPYSVFTRDRDRYHSYNLVRDAEKEEEKFHLPAWGFRHFDNEAMPLVAAGINEMLLQSHEGVIRVAPALHESLEAVFTLKARGGFLVSAEQREGGIGWVWIESELGEELVLESPWPDAKELCVWNVEKGRSPANAPTENLRVDADGCVRMATRAGAGYLIGPKADLVEQWDEVQLTPQTNQQPKDFGPVRLGKIRMF